MARRLLTLAGAGTAAIAVLHVVIPLMGGPAYRYFGAGEPMAKAAEAGSWRPAALTLVIALVFLVFSLYAFAGASHVRRPPLLRAGLIGIGLLFTLRGLSVLPQAMVWLRQPATIPGRYVAFSLVALVIGVLYLAATLTSWQALGRTPDAPLPADGSSPRISREQASAWLDACEKGLLSPPRETSDPDAWDEYWKNHLKVGPMEQGFSDAMSSDSALPALLARRGARTVLCAGNGLSMEAIALSRLGFEVTALDVSNVPARVLESVLSAETAPVTSMHGAGDQPPMDGGSVTFVTGDLLEPEVCPGPFDVVIERRTVQLLARETRPLALERLAARLGTRGIVVSQQHDGGWRPGQPRVHYAEAWLTSHGFAVWTDASGDREASAPRLAYLRLTTG